DLYPSNLLNAHSARRTGGDGEDAERGEPGHAIGDPDHRLGEESEVLEETVLLLHTNKRHPDRNTEQDYGRDKIVGQGIEGVGGNKQREPWHLDGWLDEGRTEEGGVLPGRKGQGHQQYRGKGQHPGAQEHGPNLEGEHLDVLIA